MVDYILPLCAVARVSFVQLTRRGVYVYVQRVVNFVLRLPRVINKYGRNVVMRHAGTLAISTVMTYTNLITKRYRKCNCSIV